jgi:hypothetical protein
LIAKKALVEAAWCAAWVAVVGFMYGIAALVGCM